MFTKNAVVVKPQRVMTPNVRSVMRPTNASPMVLQKFMQLLVDLSHKVDALATRPPQVVQIRPVESRQAEAKPPAAVTDKKVDRKSLWDIFD